MSKVKSDMKLRIYDFLSNIKEYDGVAMEGTLSCSCGGNKFEFSHTGKQTKGIFAPYVVSLKDQLVLKAECTNCRSSVIVYDSSKDGVCPKKTAPDNQFKPFVISKSPTNAYKARVMYNYSAEMFKTDGTYTNEFEDCLVYITDSNGKENALIEE